MFDKDTLVIAYDEERGEPRGARKKGTDIEAEGLGSCIDCTLCVQVCPTGIDIRNGLQYQCIACSACVDVCNEVMDKMGYPRNLVRYTTEHEKEGKRTHILRPRVLIYAGILVGIMVALGHAIATRIPLEMDVIRDRNRLYHETELGLVENVYTLKLINMDEAAHDYTLKVDGISSMKMLTNSPTFSLNAGEVIDIPVRLQVDPYDILKRSTEITFTLQSIDNPELKTVEKARFLGPVRGSR